MHIPTGGDNAVVVLERAALGKVERLAVHVCADTARFCNQQGTRGVILIVVGSALAPY